MTTTETDRVRELYQRDAPRYDATMGFFERVLFRDARSWVCSKAEGSTLEIAIGTGRNLPYYPADVELTGIELAPAMLELAEKRAQEVGRKVNLSLGDAAALEFPDATFDSVVCTFSLCTIPDDAAAVAEARRVLRPGGRFLLVEHVRSTRPRVRAVQKLIDPLTVRFQGDHQVREPMRHVRAEGFEVEQLERYGLGIVQRAVARRPSD